MISPRAKRNFYQILPFPVIWLVLGMIFMFIEFAATQNQQEIAKSAIKVDIYVFTYAMIAVTIVGFIVGAIENFLLQKVFSRKPLVKKIIFKTLLYAGLMVLIISIAYPVAASIEQQISLFDSAILERTEEFLGSQTFYSTMLQMAVTLFACFFYVEIRAHVGHEVMLDFFTGKYHAPIQEKRVFMFLDMKSSTTIAERLGHSKYFEFLKQYYDDISEAVINNYGEVYQYVGDELVLSWPLKKNFQARCVLDCFYEMKYRLLEKSEWYEKTFGESPTFKAGIHCGSVTAGEIGKVKKEILYTGDVLNATARIQSLCNSYAVDIIITQSFYSHLHENNSYQITALGTVALRGRKKEAKLFTTALKINTE